MDASNRSIDPSCQSPPPVAIDIILKLDVFGIVLYTVLTFMAATSMLVYIEECVYIYRKVPSNKKSIIAWVNGAAPECVYIYRKVPSNKKSIIAWVNGAAPVIGTMSCLGMWIPRSTMFTDMTSACYFAVVVFKFLVLMVEEAGGDEAFLARAPKHKLRISTGPCCCCCPCLPHVAITRRSLFLLKLGSFQFAMEITGASIWINPFVGVLTIIALWPVAIMFMHLRVTLRSIRIIPKYAMYQMFIITLVTRLLYRRHYEPLPEEGADDENENTKMVTAP
ncbi:hypothetical protein CRUP_001771 [Coryphaenoides rupestris]|nr:hypothetical protein CRUP_001771 [Coryphaenoides rupestris]